jgi:hypothetical protein
MLIEAENWGILSLQWIIINMTEFNIPLKWTAFLYDWLQNNIMCSNITSLMNPFINFY